MIRLSRAELIEVAHVLIVANTPPSLIKGLQQTPAMDKLRQCSTEELCVYYDRVTARTQSEIKVALAYATLIAFCTRGRDVGALLMDETRLRWGREVAGLLRSIPVTNLQDVSAPQLTPNVRMTSSVSAGITLYGEDNRPLNLEGR